MRSSRILFAALLSLTSLTAISATFGADSTPLKIQFTATNGKQIDLSKMTGKVVLVDFWATWCPPCRAEIPDVVKTYQKYHSQGFEIIGISLDQSRTALTQFTAKHGMTWPQYFDGLGWKNRVATKFKVRAIPAMWLIDKNGKLVTKDGRDNLEAQIAKLLKEPGPAPAETAANSKTKDSSTESQAFNNFFKKKN